jgi:uncharacterized membrane protein
MSTLIVLGFPNLGLADEAVLELERLQREELLETSDWARVIRRDDGTIDIRHATHQVGTGAVSGGFWGLLLGLLFRAPIAGAAIGATTGAVAGALHDVGVDDGFVESVGLQIQPGTSALFVQVVSATADRVAERMRHLRPTVLRTSLSEEAEARLRRALGR